MHYLVAYDIAEPKRLRRVARLLEQLGLRCQKSVFLFQGDQAAVETLLDRVAALLQPKEDVIQAWPLAVAWATVPLLRGTPLAVAPAALVLEGKQQRFVIGT